jgi:hypothetical protein
MPKTIDEEKMRDMKSMDFANPPTKDIPHMDFPMCLYLHPKSKTKKQAIFDENGIKVAERLVCTEHKSRIVRDQKELDKALKEGWRKQPFINDYDVDAHVDDEEYDLSSAKK